MKKIVALMLMLALAAACALAEDGPQSDALPRAAEGVAQAGVGAGAALLPTGVFAQIYDGQEIDLDGDGASEKLGFVPETGEAFSSFYLAVNSLETRMEEAVYLTGEIHAVRFAGVEGAFLLVSDSGMSDDPMSYIYHYLRDQEGAESLTYIGMVESYPRDMTVTGRNTFTTYVRAQTLFTWYRPADFVVATGYHWDEDSASMTFGVAEVPRDLYPVGANVTVKVEIPLLTSRTDETVCRVLEPGETAVVAATDDRQWYYLSAPAEDYETPRGGWVRLDPNTFDGILIGGESVSGMDAFDGLLYAD